MFLCYVVLRLEQNEPALQVSLINYPKQYTVNTESIHIHIGSQVLLFRSPRWISHWEGAIETRPAAHYLVIF